MKTFDLELLVGFVVLAAFALLAYVSIRLGQITLFGNEGYTVQATFTTAGGLQADAVVELAGVEIGRVEQIDLTDYQAQVRLRISHGVPLSEDAKAAIKSKGLVGERYVEISPGQANERIAPGGRIRNTESPVDIQELIANFIFGGVGQNGQTADLQ